MPDAPTTALDAALEEVVRQSLRLQQRHETQAATIRQYQERDRARADADERVAALERDLALATARQLAAQAQAERGARLLDRSCRTRDELSAQLADKDRLIEELEARAERDAALLLEAQGLLEEAREQLAAVPLLPTLEGFEITPSVRISGESNLGTYTVEADTVAEAAELAHQLTAWVEPS